MKYFNIKTRNGTETIDSVDRNDFRDFKEYKQAVNTLLERYRVAYNRHGIRVYISQRCTKDWKDR